MNKKALSLAITLAMAFPIVSNALSLGDIESNSSLNQPFRGKINLLSTNAAEAKTLRVRVASPEVFNRVGIDRPAFLNSIRFRTTIQNGRPVILVSSNQPINEPFLNFLLEVSWPNGQLLKEYTVLLDPPVLLRPDTAIASNSAGVRAEPRAQGRISRPAAPTAQQRQAQQQRLAQQQRQAAQQRRVQQQQRQAQQQRQVQQQRLQAAQKALNTGRSAAPARRAVAQQQIRSYKVKRGDTLSKVAKRLGYRGVRSEQMMIALFEKNRRAFSKNNINNLKSGALIKRPSLQEVRSVTLKKSKSQIIAQAREWKKARATALARKSGSSTKTPVSVAGNQQARMTVAGTEGSASKASGSAGNSSVAKLNKQLTMTNESLTSKRKENEELKSRVTELESLLRKKNRLITLKSEQLAKLQAATGETIPEISNTEPEVAVNESNDIQQDIANSLANENGEIIRNGEDELALVSEDNTSEENIAENIFENAEGEDIASDSEAESAFVENEPAGTDIMSLLSSPTALGIGGGSLLAVLGGLWYMRRRKSDDDEYEEFSSIDIDNQMDGGEDSSMIDESEFVAHDEVHHDATSSNESDLEDNGEEDILQEADVYIVYGLHDQAESELKQAIEKEPNNMAYRAKLLENYKAAGDVESFETEAKAFMAINSDDKEKYLGNITDWGRALNPESKLFSGSSSLAVAGAGVAMVAGTALADSDDNKTVDIKTDDFDINDGLEDFNLDDILSDDEDELIDNDNLSDNDNVINADDQNTDLGMALDIDFDEDIKLGDEVVKNDFDNEIDSVDDLLDANNAIDLPEGMDFNFEGELDNNLDEDMDITSLNLDIGSDDFDKIMPEDNAYKSSSQEEVLVEDNLLADFDDNLSFLDLDDNVEVIEETQIDTKLDLAKAYIDMGDIEGARSTLEEVMQDGSDEQKREAEELLHQAG